MKLAFALCLAHLFLLLSVCYAQITPPKPGVDLPQAYFDRVSSDKTAFQFKNAWIQKTRRVKETRQRFLEGLRGDSRGLASLSDDMKRSIVVSGTVSVPAILAQFANTAATPYPASRLRRQLFDGPWSTGTMAELYAEMSNGNITLTGEVYDWITLPQNDTFYEGGSGCYGLCGSARTGQFILDILTASDASIDFGQYDNDGPDGVPNSGDDDGFVDFVAFVHPEIGAECGGNDNLWSHRWIVQGWPEFSGPWQTNDSRAGGGNILIQDYTIQPALSCGGSTIEIGVFCHEFGHAFGLPDLYDTDGGGEGIGHHGLMATGNWNTPENPSHMSAWSKMELGWVIPVEVGGPARSYTINNVNQTGEVYRLDVVEEKFSRRSVDPIAGSFSLHCGLTDAEANNRNWPASGGYGNGWRESIVRDFSYDGTGPVALQFDLSYDTELNFDVARIRIDVNGNVTTVRSYTGNGSASGVAVDLTPYLDGSGATSYQLIAELASDYSWSDEDGNYNSGSGGPFKLDNVSVTGGGENYFCDFEQNEGGWHHDATGSRPSEFFLVENRSKAGQFDQALDAEGLFVWHVEENVMHSSLGNSGGTGGTTNLRPAGVTLEEADGLAQILMGINRGDAGDVRPGSTNSRTFDNTTNPNSTSHNGSATQILIADISDPGPQMTATLRAGYLPPTVGSVSPTSGNSEEVIAISDLSGTGFVHGATFLLRDESMTEHGASNVSWIGENKLAGDLDLTGVPAGSYDLLVRNPDGQEAILSGGFQVNSTVPVLIQDFAATATGTSVELTWQIWSDEAIQGFRVLRRQTAAIATETLNASLIAPHLRRFVDEVFQPATSYHYILLVVLRDGSELRSQSVTARTASYALELHQNEPNPFNPSTRIRFSLPQRTHARLVIYDPSGRRLATLVDEIRGPGVQHVVWDGRNESGASVASGVYFYRLDVQSRVITKKLLLLK
ncbi:MAG: M6 family metalloprotease domain-containing protein [Candidatus Krumholzibacteria bacterium]|nr:M6 family metalloprotease domain-containing protein [Candidatus Krumholzibacteria bacterium]